MSAVLDPYTRESLALADATVATPPHELVAPPGDVSQAAADAASGEVATVAGDGPPPPPATPLPDQADPGRCNVHGERLITHKRAGLRWYGDQQPAVVCPVDHGEDPTDRERCTYCGGRLIPVDWPRWRTTDRRAFCSDLCRNYNHRRARRVKRREARSHG